MIIHRCDVISVRPFPMCISNLISSEKIAAGRPCRAGVWLLWLIPSLYAVALLSLGTFDLLRPVPPHGLVFNSMLDHLLHGQFDVDPAAITVEAFIRNGRTIAYFGIFGAILRLPLLLTKSLDRTDVTVLSLAVAVALSWLFRLLALLTVYRHARPTPRTTELVLLAIFAAAFGGESIQFLRPSIYQEVISWSVALAAGFIWLLIRFVLIPNANPRRHLIGMSLFAGLTFLARPSTAIGLYAALSSVIGVRLLRDHASRGITRAMVIQEFLGPVAILASFAAIAGLVNFGRWGNPFQFMDMRLYAMSHTVFLDRLPRLVRYGEFNVRRIFLGWQYYFAPLWIVPLPDGHLMLRQSMLRLFDGAELPPGSLLLTDPVTCLFAAYFFLGVVRGRPAPSFDRGTALAAISGLAIPAVLMLTFIYLSHRYRMELYPFLDAASYFGLALLVRNSSPSRVRWDRTIAVLGGVGTTIAHFMLLAYWLTAFAPAADLNLSDDVIELYVSRLQGQAMLIGPHIMP